MTKYRTIQYSAVHSLQSFISAVHSFDTEQCSTHVQHMSLSVCLLVYGSVSDCLSLYLSVCLSVFPSVHLSVSLYLCCLSVSVCPVCLSLCLYLCLSLCCLSLSVCL